MRVRTAIGRHWRRSAGHFVILGGAALLVACGGGDVPPNDQAAAPGSPPNAVAPAPEPENGAAGLPGEPAEAASIPADFRGNWAETAAFCGATGHASRLAISDSTLRFHESVATVSRVERLGPREVNIHVTATGEGTTWPAEYHYSLDAAGDTLTDQAGGGMVRTRCAG